MLSFCTLFNTRYLSRGIAMYESLIKYCKNFHLYIFAFDDLTLEILKKLNLDKVTVISLKEFEDDELLSIKNTRTPKEYCWTCSPAVILYCIEKYNLDMCTYLDADIYFFSSPEVLIDELESKNKSVLLTYLRCPPDDLLISLVGKYCVQFMTFKNNDDGLKALKWWREKCIEWCYDINETTRYGDQKYLDDWNERFNGIHDLEHLGGGVAPWNVKLYNFSKSSKDDYVYGIEKTTNKEFKLVFYHMQGIAFYDDNTIDLGTSYLPKESKTLIYKPYIYHISKIKLKLLSINNSFDPNGTVKKPRGLKFFIKKLRTKRRKIYNIHKENFFINKD